MPHDPITPMTTLVRRDAFITSPMDKDLAMMSLESNAYFGLDAIGRAIWEMLERPMSVNALCGVLQQRFEVEREQCLADVLPFLEELRGENMIRIGDAQGAGGK
jgi:hypothetical protein